MSNALHWELGFGDSLMGSLMDLRKMGGECGGGDEREKEEEGVKEEEV